MKKRETPYPTPPKTITIRKTNAVLENAIADFLPICSLIGFPQLGQILSAELNAVPHSLHFSSFSIGQPQLGQTEALSETSCPHSLHLKRAIIFI